MAKNLTPLNGTKTHPLTKHSIECLRSLAEHGPRPRQVINAGVSNRLERDALVESVQLPSPYFIHSGKNIVHLQITAAGRAALAKPTPATKE